MHNPGKWRYVSVCGFWGLRIFPPFFLCGSAPQGQQNGRMGYLAKTILKIFPLNGFWKQALYVCGVQAGSSPLLGEFTAWILIPCSSHLQKSFKGFPLNGFCKWMVHRRESKRQIHLKVLNSPQTPLPYGACSQNLLNVFECLEMCVLGSNRDNWNVCIFFSPIDTHHFSNSHHKPHEPLTILSNLGWGWVWAAANESWTQSSLW